MRCWILFTSSYVLRKNRHWHATGTRFLFVETQDIQHMCVVGFYLHHVSYQGTVTGMPLVFDSCLWKHRTLSTCVLLDSPCVIFLHRNHHWHATGIRVLLEKMALSLCVLLVFLCIIFFTKEPSPACHWRSPFACSEIGH